MHLFISLLRISQPRIACCACPPTHPLGVVRPDHDGRQLHRSAARSGAPSWNDAGQARASQRPSYHAIRDGRRDRPNGQFAQGTMVSSRPPSWLAGCVRAARRLSTYRVCNDTDRQTEKQHACSDRRPDAAGQGRGGPNRQRSSRGGRALGLSLRVSIALSCRAGGLSAMMDNGLRLSGNDPWRGGVAGGCELE